MRILVPHLLWLLLALATSAAAQDRSPTRSTGGDSGQHRSAQPAKKRQPTGGQRPFAQGVSQADAREVEQNQQRSDSIPDAPIYDDRESAFEDTPPAEFSADSEVRNIATANERPTTTPGRQQYSQQRTNADSAKSNWPQSTEPPAETPTTKLTTVATVLPQLEPVPLSPRSTENRLENDKAGNGPLRAMPKAWSSVVTVLASLGLVLGLFFAVAWVMRRGVPGAIPILPKSAVEVLGRMPMPGRHQMQLLRCGNKLLLIHMSQSGAETLTEITSPEEVDRLAGLCQQRHGNSSSKAFQDVLEQLGRERREPGDDEPEPFGARLTSQRSARRGFDRGMERDG